MANNSKIEWREASDDEFKYIKEKYARPTAALTVGMMFMFLLMVATVAFVIYCNTKKHNIGAIICSVIVYLTMLIFMVATVYVIAINIQRLICFYRRRFLVSDATVQNVNVQMGTRGKTRAKIQFITSTGVHVNLNSTGLEPLAEKGKQALMLNLGKSKRKFLQYVVLCMMILMCTGCSVSDIVPEPESQTYSKIEKPYTDKAEINNKSENVYKRTVAGTLKYIDDGDKAGLKKMLCKGLLDMKDTDAEIDALLDGFKGDIKDTTYISGDLGARTNAQWSKTEEVACYESEFYVYTDKETYYVKLDMCAVNDRDADGKDSVGVTRLHVMTLDKKYEADATPNDAAKAVETKTVGASQCSILSEYGNSDGYQALNTSTEWSDNDVWKLTGTKDSISLEDLKKIDYKDEKAVRKVFNSMDQYAITESDAHCRLYNLSDSDKKVHVYSDNYGDGDDSYRVKFVQIIDISEPYGKQDRESIYNYKDK